jgi:hypothetical protein
MKRILLFFIITAVVAVSVFAQEKTGYIKPTLGVGYGSASQNGVGMMSGMTLSLDIDFVSRFGFTLGFSNIFLFDELGINFHPFGLGYTYTATKWSIGGKLLAVPTTHYDGGIGFNVIGTYWFNNYVGLSGIFNLFSGMAGNGGTVYSIRMGISTKI